MAYAYPRTTKTGQWACPTTESQTLCPSGPGAPCRGLCCPSLSAQLLPPPPRPLSPPPGTPPASGLPQRPPRPTTGLRAPGPLGIGEPLPRTFRTGRSTRPRDGRRTASARRTPSATPRRCSRPDRGGSGGQSRLPRTVGRQKYSGREDAHLFSSSENQLQVK